MAKFLTSARTVDMLGRQQIAGIPTALSELFKNAYDAYALNVRGDYFPARHLMMLRDDGIGMSEDDFTKRWLTIGTDSKAKDSQSDLPRKPESMPLRRQMGEKGIGRLAIATIGPQVLLVSRTSDVEGHYVVALVQWSLFEIPGLTLDDVAIPTRFVAELDELTPVLIAAMRDEISNSVLDLQDRIPASRRKQIAAELGALETNVQPLLRLNGPDLANHSGTAFIVSPVSPDVDSVISERASTNDSFQVSKFQRFLLGFSNTITDNPSPLGISTEFVLHGARGAKDIIDPADFWKSEDFKSSDHVIEGSFDGNGQFSGTVSVYGGAPVPYVEAWQAGKGSPSACGPFSIKFGYVQGEAKGSRLSGEQFAVMTARLESLGGLYVYRDGIRVLPYGNADTDYLQIEQRRTLNAGRYYFSYRRMFGAIELDSELNSGLQEKAGREGFRENQAYRDFTSILREFLIQTAATFFSVKSPEGEEWRNTRQGLNDRSQKARDRERVEARIRDAFASSVEQLVHEFESGALARSLQQVKNAARVDIDRAVDLSSAGDLDAAERSSLERLEALSLQVRLSRPSTVALTVDQEREWNDLVRRTNIFSDDIKNVSYEIAREIEMAEGRIADRSIDHPGRRLTRVTSRREELVDVVSRHASTSRDALSDGVAYLSSQIDGASNDFDKQSLAIIGEMPLVTAEVEVETLNALQSVADMAIATLVSLEARASRINSDYDDVDVLALQEELLDLREQLSENLEVLQLGLAVQLVSHEFESSIRAVRNGLQDLTPWAKSSPRVDPIVRDLKASFAHLDAYLRLFTPLQRRLYRQASTFSGDAIAAFVRGVFDDRLERESVELQVTPAFRDTQIDGYPSTFYPAFVNLVDNAIHWTSAAGRGGVVRLDSEAGVLVVEDNGPGVRPRDWDAIFERGFSRRRGGRGLGLSLARDLLSADGWDLELDRTFERGARFTLREISDERGGES